MDILDFDNGTPSLSLEQAVDEIVLVNTKLADFWSNAHGWAPCEAATLLSKSRLDWQVSLSRCLKFSIRQLAEAPQEDGALILAWVNLGCLVEGTMKLVLAVFYNDYADDANAILRRDASLVEPDVLDLESLRRFFEKKDLIEPRWSKFVLRIQQRRNGVHAFRDRPIGTPAEFLDSVREYLEFLRDTTSAFPYPDGPR